VPDLNCRVLASSESLTRQLKSGIEGERVRFQPKSINLAAYPLQTSSEEDLHGVHRNTG
jgi:hypothetical protein